jgi:hypothetical protein
VEVAERFGADVLDATTDQQANELPTGSLTLLVPDDSYTAVLTEMSGLGQVRSQHIQAVRRQETFDEATPPPEGSPEPTATYSRLVVTISEPRSLANIAQTTWGIARQVMLYSAQAVMLLAVFAIPLVLAVGLLRLGIWGWRRLFNGSLARRPTPTPAADEAERQPSDIGA